jgi:type I restriction enzyme, S subunit
MNRGLRRIASEMFPWISEFALRVVPQLGQSKPVTIFKGHNVGPDATWLISGLVARFESNPDWPVKTLGQILELSYGKPLEAKDRDDKGSVPVYGANGVKAYSKKSLVVGPSIIVGRKGSAGELNFCEGPFWPLDVTYYVEHDANETDLSFLHYLLSLMDLPSLAKGVKPGINRNDVYALQSTVPPLEEQKQIVARLDSMRAKTLEMVAAYDAKLIAAKNLRQSILEAAFAGDL